MTSLWPADQIVHWKSIDEVFGVAEVPFAGGFDTVRRGNTTPASTLYQGIVADSLGASPEPRLEKTESSRTENNSAAQIDIYGDPDAGGAHSVPHSPICSPLWGIHVQAFLGFDIERHIGKDPDKRELLKKTLQQVVCGRKNSDRRATGFRYVPYNLLWLPKNHQNIYDNNPLLIVVPILTLDEVKNWDPTEAYWVMVIAGRLSTSPPEWTNDYLYNKRVIMNTRALAGRYEKCSRGDIRKAAALMSQFVQGHADVLMGREGRNHLVPEDLFSPMSDAQGVHDRKAMLQNTRAQLNNTRTVKVPVPVFGATGDDDMVVENVFKSKITPAMKTDPAPLASKAAVNWTGRCGQQSIPTCPCPVVDPEDEEEAELYELGRELCEEGFNCIRTSMPTEVTVGVIGSSRRVTLSPPKKGTDDSDVSDLNDDD